MGGCLPKWCDFQLMNVKTRLQIQELKQIRLCTSLSNNNCHASYTSALYSWWERRAVFLSPYWTKITTTATFSRFAQPAFNRDQPNFYLKCTHMSYVSVPIFVNFGLLSTKWEFFKLGWCLHRKRSQVIYRHSAGRPSRGTYVPHPVAFELHVSIQSVYIMTDLFNNHSIVAEAETQLLIP